MPSSGPSGRPAPRAWILGSPGASQVEIWGLSPPERLRRSLARAGCAGIGELAPGEALGAPRDGTALLARDDLIYDERIVEALARSRDTLLVDPATGEGVAACVAAERAGELVEWIRQRRAGAPPGVRAVAPGELVSGYIPLLRKHEPAYLYAADAAQAARVEERTFAAAYKGATDLVTKWVWPMPARAATRWLARRGVHPNSVTVASWALALAAGWLFAIGRFGTGLAVAWLMTFLDTVDGKLARVTLRSSHFGHVLDHSLDLIHPPFWWFAWAWGVGAPFAPATWIVVAGYLLGRLEEGIFLLCFEIEIHCWRPIDALFRTVTARRNPNLLLLSVAAVGGRPDLGLVLVAIWTLASLGFHAVRIAQALVARAQGGAVRPFDESLADPARRGAVAPAVGEPR